MNKIGVIKIIIVLILSILPFSAYGKYIDKCFNVSKEYSGKPIVLINDSCYTQYYTLIDTEGNFKINGVKTGVYTVYIDTFYRKNSRKNIVAKGVIVDEKQDTIKIANIENKRIKFGK